MITLKIGKDIKIQKYKHEGIKLMIQENHKDNTNSHKIVKLDKNEIELFILGVYLLTHKRFKK